MPAHSHRVQDYLSRRQAAAYGVRARASSEYRQCDHLRLVTGFRQQGAESVDDVLRELRGGDFADRAMRVRQGREMRFLEAEPLVGRLVQALKRAVSTEDVIEHCLEVLFEDLRAGEIFEHTELVMAILFALKQAKVPTFRDTAGFFASSRAAEIRRLRQFSRELLSA